MLQNNPVVDEANIFGGVVGFGSFLPQEVEDTSGQHSELAVLNEFTEVRQACLFALWVLLNNADDAVHNGSLVFKATLRSKRELLSWKSQSILETLSYPDRRNIPLKGHSHSVLFNVYLKGGGQ